LRRRRRQTLPLRRPRGSNQAWLELAGPLKRRLPAVLDPERPVTDPELRKLADEGRACSLILGAELKRGEQRLAELEADPAAPLAEIAAEFREVNTFRAHLEELHSLLVQLDERAREARTAWL
jgi:hypothetical protein